MSTARAAKVAPAARTMDSGWSGGSREPAGLDRVRLPRSDVGEYCPLVSP